MTDVVLNEHYATVGNLYTENKRYPKGGYTFVWTVSEETNELLVGISICHPDDMFDRKRGLDQADINLIECEEGPLNLILDQDSFICFIDQLGLLEGLWNSFSRDYIEEMIYRPFHEVFSVEAITGFVERYVQNLWLHRFEKKLPYFITKMGSGFNKYGEEL